MNKKLLIGLITAALVLGGSFAVGASEIPIFDLKTNKLKYEKEFIPAEQAKTIALNEVNGTVEDVEIEKENGHYYYEVEVDKDNIDYDIFVEAYTGKIAYIKVENDDKIKNINEVESSKNTNELEKDDSHDDGTQEVTIENKPQSSSTSKPAVTQTAQNTQVHDDGNDDRDDDRQEKIKSTQSPVPAASKPVTTKPVQKTQVRDHVRDDDEDDWDDDRDDDNDDDGDDD